MAKTVALLLTLWLALPLKGQTYMLEAERFQYVGGWKVEKDAEAFNKAVLMVTAGGSGAAHATTVFQVPQSGRYVFWSRTKDFQTKAPRTRISRLMLDTMQLALQGIHGREGYHWEQIGTIELHKGLHVLRACDVAANYARVDAVLFTRDEGLDPNQMTYKQLTKYEIQPIPTPLEKPSTTMAQNALALLNTSSPVVDEISNGLLRLRIHTANNQLVQHISVHTKGQWRSWESPQPHNRLYIIKSTRPQLGYNSIFPLWSGGQAPLLRVGNNTYPVFEQAHLQNPFLAGKVCPMHIFRHEKAGQNTLHVWYVSTDNDTIASTWTLHANSHVVDVQLEYVARTPQYYSLAFEAFQPQAENAVTNVLLSPLYQFKRLPPTPNLLPITLTPQPVSIIETGNLSCFLAPNPHHLKRNWGIYDMGLSLKNAANQVQPVAFSPILGEKDSYKKKGEKLTAHFKLGLLPLQWHNTLQYLSDSVFAVRDYRVQTTPLTDAVFHTINLIKNDEAAGWDAAMRGFLDIESNPNVRTEVVQAAPLALVSAAVVTHDEQLYTTRALPAIEYMLSRKGFRWGYPQANDPQTQTPMNTFSPFGSQYNTAHFEALHRLLGHNNPWLADIAMPKGKPRYSKGYGVDQTWADDLAAFRLTKADKWLVKATNGANHELHTTLYNNPSKPILPWMFYHSQAYPQWFDLLDLYDVCKDKVLLAASAYAAHFTIAGIRTYPPVGNDTILIHQGGKYVGNANVFWKKDKPYKLGYPRKTGDVSEKKVAQHTLSPVGLGFEQPMTFFNREGNINHTFMSTWAPSLLRLSGLCGNSLFETYARNAVIGRFASYPGYYAAGYTDLPLDSVYPYKGPDVTSLYYHHIPSHLSFVLDYLLTEATQRSKGAIGFPYGKQEGFVWFNNRVYGGEKGYILNDRDAQLYMPQDMLRLSSTHVNWLSAVSANNLWLILMNEKDSTLNVSLRLNTPLVSPNGMATEHYFAQTNSVVSEERSLNQNALTVTIAPKGITFVSFPLAKSLPTYPSSPINNGFKMVQLDSNHRLYLFRIRSPFGWDSLYGYIDTPLTKGYSASLTCQTVSARPQIDERVAFPYEWSITHLPTTMPLNITMKIGNEHKTIITKLITM